VSSLVDGARAAHDARDWERTLEIVDAADTVGPDDLLLKADALYWTGRFDEAAEAFESAHVGFVAEGNAAEAGLIAALLAYFAVRRESFSVAQGWLTRAHELLDGASESIGHSWLKLLHVGIALFKEGDVSGALARCDDAVAFAKHIGSASSQAIAMSFKGLAMTQTPDWRDGLELMDEAMIVAMSGSDDLRMTSDVYCNIISACRNFGDYVRAEEWTAEAERWMRANAVSGYTGACKVHRAELKLFHGAWEAAEAESRNACVELERFRFVDYLGLAHYWIGETRRRMGDLARADEEFEEAYASGHDAQPGLSLLMLDRGDIDGALQSIKGAAIRRDPGEQEKAWKGPSRARLLPALVDIAIAAGDLELALSAAEELTEIAETFDSAVWRANAAACRGAVSAASGKASEAIEMLESARRQYQRLDLPYEMALAQALLGETRAKLGDSTRARLDLRSALDAMRQLGASRQVDRIEGLLGEDSTTRISGSRSKKTFMFSDIVKSTDLISVIGDDQWEELLGWHDRTIREEIEKAGGEVVRHTGDGFFAAFDEPRSAIDSAVEIQRKLRRHRRDSGFALQVRIGLHQAEATREGADYSGHGVHVAARIGALASSEQIILSNETMADMGPVPYNQGTPRYEHLKGVPDPVEVTEVDWR
jgi:class 3 adenylate cyclase